MLMLNLQSSGIMRATIASMQDTKYQNAFRHLAKLQEVSALLLRARSTSEVTNIILNQGVSVLGAATGEVVLLGNKKKIEIVAYQGYSAAIQKKLATEADKTPLLTREVIRTKKPLFFQIDELKKTKYKFARYFLSKTQTNAGAVLPLHINGKVMGVLEFTFKTSNELRPEAQKFMLALADQCAQAFDKVTALENLTKSNEELKVILKRIADGVIVRDSKGIIIYTNEAALQIHGLKSSSEMIGLTPEGYTKLVKSISGEGDRDISPQDSTFLKILSGKSYARGVYKILYKNSKDFKWLNIKSVAIYNRRNELYLIVSVIQDITSDKQREYFKDEFMSIASHELKTPLTSLKAFTQVLLKNFEKEGNLQAANLLVKMDMQISKLSHLVRDLLDVTKIAEGRLQFHESQFALDELIREVIEEIQPTTVKAIITKGFTPIHVFADRDRIAQVLINFLTNAIKYSPQGKKVIVHMTTTKDTVTIGVEDFGIGIPTEKQPHVFERFYRETGFKENTFPGLGLGLYIASQIIKRQQGKIWLKSLDGKGSTFFFSLPTI